MNNQLFFLVSLSQETVFSVLIIQTVIIIHSRLFQHWHLSLAPRACLKLLKLATPTRKYTGRQDNIPNPVGSTNFSVEVTGHIS